MLKWHQLGYIYAQNWLLLDRPVLFLLSIANHFNVSGFVQYLWFFNEVYPLTANIGPKEGKINNKHGYFSQELHSWHRWLSMSVYDIKRHKKIIMANPPPPRSPFQIATRRSIRAGLRMLHVLCIYYLCQCNIMKKISSLGFETSHTNTLACHILQALLFSNILFRGSNNDVK